MGDEALLPLRLFRNGVFALGSAQSFVIGIGMFGGMASIPLYLQIVKGASPTKAGLLILPMVAGHHGRRRCIAGQVTSRTGHYRKFPIIGSALLVIGLVLLSTVGADTPLWQTDLFMLIFGAGLGMNMQTLVLAMQNAVPAEGHGRRDRVGDVLPPGRRHAGHRGVPVDPVLGRRAATSSPPYAKAAKTPAVPGRAAARTRDQLRS